MVSDSVMLLHCQCNQGRQLSNDEPAMETAMNMNTMMFQLSKTDKHEYSFNLVRQTWFDCRHHFDQFLSVIVPDAAHYIERILPDVNVPGSR